MRVAAIKYATVVLVASAVLAGCGSSSSATSGVTTSSEPRPDATSPPVGGTYRTIDVPNSIGTVANDINNKGDVVGLYLLDGDDTVHTFLYSGGEFSTVDFPGSPATFGGGISDAGEIVGDYIDREGVSHGFRWRDGEFETIDAPGAENTYVTKINNSGEIVGTVYTADGIQGFVLRDDEFSMVDTEDSADVFINGVNDAGEVVGMQRIATGMDRIGPPLRELSFATTAPVGVSIPSREGEFVGDRFVIRAEDAELNPIAQTRIEMVAANTGPLFISREATVPPPEEQDRVSVCQDGTTCVFDGFPNDALGAATLSVENIGGIDVLRVDGIGPSMVDGVSQSVPQTMEMQTELLTPNFSLSEEGAALLTTQFGIVGEDSNIRFSSLKIANVGTSLRVTGDWSPIGTTSYEVQVFNGSELVTSQTGLKSAELLLSGKPDIRWVRCHIWVILWKHTYAARTSDPIDIRAPAEATEVNEIAFDINSSRAVIGQYYKTDPDEVRGFLWENGRSTPLDAPDARVTGPVGMNDAGQVVGFYDDNDGRRHGFILDPP